MTPRYLTGMGIVSPIGTGRTTFFEELRRATPIVSRAPAPVESFDASALGKDSPPRLAEVRGFDASEYLGDKGLRTLDRLTKLMIVSSRLALHDAGLKRDGAFVASSPARCGIVSSNAYGSLEAIVELDRVAKFEDARYINPAKFPNTVANSASGYVSIWEELKALNVAISDGNCGALDAIACADIYLETGRADVILVGGAEAMSEALYLAFQKFGALSETTCLSEGSAFFALETEEHVKARGASVLGRVLGFGTAFLPPPDESTLIHPSEEALRRAVLEALEDAKLEPSAIQAVATSIPGITPFDRAELGALRSVLPDTVALAQPKAWLGESLGAGGAYGMAVALGWLHGAPVAPLVAGAPPSRPPEHVLVTSMGLYGNASAVVLAR
jgi:3-oxoacyl-(acyl-carrier-protein) synthase